MYRQSVYSCLWKISHITPIPKINNPESLSDYRPISILCFLSKVFEKILASQIRDYISDIIPKNQSGFRQNYSCVTALEKVINDIVESTDKNKLTILILLDYSKAFDKLDHGLLLSILKYIGFNSKSTSLLSSYLKGRQQAVTYGSVTSSYKSSKNGVPQGSILGPLLFILYTFQVSNYLKYCDSHFYGDDTQLYASFREEEVDIFNKYINEDLAALSEISDKMCLELNPLKTQMLLFGRPGAVARVRDQVSITLNNSPLTFTERAKDLGIIIDSDLQFGEHVTSILKKGYSTLKLLYGSKDILNRKSRWLTCNSLVLSHITYGLTVYGPFLTTSELGRLQKLQNCCVRFVYGLRKYDHISKHSIELEILPVKEKIEYYSCLLFYKILALRSPSYLFDLITYRNDVHHLNLRHRNTLQIPVHTIALFQNSISYRIAKLMNSLPVSLRNISLPTFKQKLKSSLLERSY